jgi:CTP:molybdopterin cytidylyltransferase MocA
VLEPAAASGLERLDSDSVVLVLLAAGRGTRFGPNPKCVQPVAGKPLARHSIDAFRELHPGPAVCVIGYQHEAVAAALGQDPVYVLSADPCGGTAYAAYEAFALPALRSANPRVVVAMGDRIVTAGILEQLLAAHGVGAGEAAATFLAARYIPPGHRGKGRVMRDALGRIVRIIEQRDIDALADEAERRRLDELTEANCPLYVCRAATLLRRLGDLTNANAQQQFYLTDLVEALGTAGEEVRAVTVAPGEEAYDLVCADVTRPEDLPRLEALIVTGRVDPPSIEAAAGAVEADRPPVQVAAIAGQIERLWATAVGATPPFRPAGPVGLGVVGGRLRIAFMHPDMVRFLGPAWQMPIGAGEPGGAEQILVVAQSTEDRRLHFFPTDPRYRESVDSLAGDGPESFPDAAVSDVLAYEVFGTRLSETLLAALGYVSDGELDRCRAAGWALPPAWRWIRNNLRRPFPLIGNAIASLRTLCRGPLGARVQSHLGPGGFRGLCLLATGSIPEGGFASSSALTLATENALNALFGLGLSEDVLVRVACQAEYGTGVRAGSLDQATEQKGRAGQGALISSNPRDNYRVLGTYRVPSDRFAVFFPYTVPRDIDAWRWSGGAYAESPQGPGLTAAEFRKLTGKAAEIAALLVEFPLDCDLFDPLETDLVSRGILGEGNRAWVAGILRALPQLIRRDDLRSRLAAERDWLAGELVRTREAVAPDAERIASLRIEALLSGWRDPVLRRATADGRIVEETGVPLRAIMAYLFAEVARNFRLIHEPDRWIHWVTWSQRGDRWFDLNPDRLPPRALLERTLDWEHAVTGPERLARWLHEYRATPFDYQRGLDDDALASQPPPALERLPGGNFFRGLALVDFAEALLHRAFGSEAVAVRINAAGQGDYFQVHVDTRLAPTAEVQRFLRAAFYGRFGLAPSPDFVTVHPGGGAASIRLERFDDLPRLARCLRRRAGSGASGQR